MNPALGQVTEGTGARALAFESSTLGSADNLKPAFYEFEAGVLFVHGIGTQPRGETLTRFAEPIVDAMERWFHGVTDHWVKAVSLAAARSWVAGVVDPALTGLPDSDSIRETAHYFCRQIEHFHNTAGDKALSDQVPSAVVAGWAHLKDVVITPRAAADLDAPPHGLLEIGSLGVDGTTRRTTLLLAEAWWARTFISPTFQDLFSWGFRIVPLALGTHFGAVLRRAVRRCFGEDAVGSRRLLRLMQATAAFLQFALAVLLCPIVQAVLLVLFIAALPPIAKWRAWLLRAQEVLAGTVGDCFALSESAIRRAAIVAQVKHDLRWLSRRCRSVIIVAHSQGAAVSHLALREERPPEVVEIITFGSGLQKLALLMQQQTIRTTKFGWIGLVGLIILGGAIRQLLEFQFQRPAAWYAWLTAEQAERAFGIGLGFVIGFSMLVGGFGALVQRVPLIHVEFWEQQIRRLGVKWRDYYASADPVPNGPLFENEDGTHGEPKEPQFQSIAIENRGSPVSDHTSYWSNREQFVVPLALRIARLGGIELNNLLPEDERALHRAQQQREFRVSTFVVVRYVIMLATCAMICLEWTTLWATGEAIGAAVLGDTTLIQTIKTMIGTEQSRGWASVARVPALYGLALLGWLWWTALDMGQLWRRGEELWFGTVLLRSFAFMMITMSAGCAVGWTCEATLVKVMGMETEAAEMWSQTIAILTGVIPGLALMFFGDDGLQRRAATP